MAAMKMARTPIVETLPRMFKFLRRHKGKLIHIDTMALTAILFGLQLATFSKKDTICVDAIIV